MPEMPHNNAGLFSDHYLKTRLGELSGEELEQARADQQALREIYQAGVPVNVQTGGFRGPHGQLFPVVMSHWPGECPRWIMFTKPFCR